MPEVTDAVNTPQDRYKESDDFVPNPTDVFGTLDTSSTAGAADSAVEVVSPIFEVAKAQAAIEAAKALDPDDDSVPLSTVVLPGDVRTRDDAIAAVQAQGEAAAANPVEIGGLSPFQREAAEATGEEGAEVAQAQQQSSGAGSTASANDASRQTGGSSASSTTATGAPAKGK